MSDTVRITLKKSPIGANPKHRACIRGLGLRRMHQTVQRPNTPEIWGMVRSVSHLVEVEESQ